MSARRPSPLPAARRPPRVSGRASRERLPVVVRAFCPRGRARERRQPAGKRAELEPGASRRHLRGPPEGRHAAARLQARGRLRRVRAITIEDPYRFLPTVGELDLHLVGEGRHDELWTRLGAHCARSTACAAPRSRSGRRRPRRSPSSATSTSGTARIHPMRALGAVGRVGAVPARRRRRRALQVRDPRARRRAAPEGRPVRLRRPRCRPRRRRSSHDSEHEWGDEEWIARAPRARRRSTADVDLRGPPGLVAAEPARGQPLADLPRAGRRAGRLRRATWASRTSSCCR